MPPSADLLRRHHLNNLHDNTFKVGRRPYPAFLATHSCTPTYLSRSMVACTAGGVPQPWQSWSCSMARSHPRTCHRCQLECAWQCRGHEHSCASIPAARPRWRVEQARKVGPELPRAAMLQGEDAHSTRAHARRHGRHKNHKRKRPRPAGCLRGARCEAPPDGMGKTKDTKHRAHHGARTRDHTVKSRTLCQLS